MQSRSPRLCARRLRRAWPALALLLPALASATEIATNLRLDFNEQASFATGIDRSLSFDAATDATRILGSRLGSFSSGSMTFSLSGRHSVSITDPGVAVAPVADRSLLSVVASASATGGLLSNPVAQNLGATWVCPAPSLGCASSTAFSNLQIAAPVLRPPANATELLQPIRLQASATATPLIAGAQLNSGTLLLNGSLQVNALFTAKEPAQYVADALAATAGAGGGAATAGWAAAAADVRALRDARWTDVAVASSLQARRTPELETAQRLLTVARDGASLLTIGATRGASFSSPFELTRQLWNVVATADPALGRGLAGSSTNEGLRETDRAAELAMMRLVRGGADDASFAAGVAAALALPFTVGPTPALTLDGASMGLTGATLSVFFLGGPFGEVVINLPGADRHALWRNGFDSVALLEGPAAGMTVLGSDNLAGTLLRLGRDRVYLNERSSGLLELSGGQTAARLQLNNNYGDDILVVASWGVSPVPEPGAALLLAAGLVLVGARRLRA